MPELSRSYRAFRGGDDANTSNTILLDARVSDARRQLDIDCTIKPASQRRHTLMTSDEWARACVFFRLGTRSDHLLHLFRPLSKKNDLYSTRPDSFYLNLFLFTYQGALHSLMSLMRKESKLSGLGLQ